MAKDSLTKERLDARDLDLRRLGLLLTASCRTKGRPRRPFFIAKIDLSPEPASALPIVSSI